MGQLTPTDQRDIPYHVTPCSAIKEGRKKEDGEDVRSDVLCLPKQPLHVMGPAFLEMAKHLPADGKERTNYLFCFAYMRSVCFAY